MPRGLRIIHIINNLLLGGAENLMSTLLPALQERGNHIHLICLNNLVYPPYRQALLDAGIKITVLHNGSVYDPRLIRLLAKTIKQHNPDVVHAHLFPATYWTSLACRLYKLSCVRIMTEHDTSNRRMKNPWLKWPERLVYKGYDGVICISKGVQEALQKHMPFVAAVAIPNGISLEAYTNLKPSPPSKEVLQQLAAFTNKRVLLLSVGRLAIKKNQETLIRMMPFLPEHVCLIICGEGDRRPVLEQLIRDEKVADRVWLAGAQEQIPYFIHQAHIGLLSSTIEGFGLAAVEMMAGGLPVLCSNVAGLNDICPDSFLLLNPHDAKGYAERVSILLKEPERYKKLQALCMATTSQYSLNHMADAYHQYYVKQCGL
jgi:glycosyltransferase involved in cell wall biosynthesis